jgi:hypothetical protein
MEKYLRLLQAGGMAAASALNPAQAALGLAQPIFQAGLAGWQAIQRRKIAQSHPMPAYKIPGAATNALWDSYNLSHGQMPGISQAQQLLAQQQAGTNSAIMNTGGAGTMAALAMQDRNSSDASLTLAGQMQAQQAGALQNYIGQQDAYAQWQAKQFEWDKQRPYLDAMATSAAMGDASNVNFHDAIGTAAESISGAITNPEDVKNSAFPSAASTALGKKASGFNFKNPPISSGVDAMTRTNIGSLMPTNVDSRARRKPAPTYMPELDNMGKIGGYK